MGNGEWMVTHLGNGLCTVPTHSQSSPLGFKLVLQRFEHHAQNPGEEDIDGGVLDLLLTQLVGLPI